MYALQVLKRHGLSVEQYRAILQRQGSRCAVCREPLGDTRRDRHIDHDHVTGAVRGILCPSCNLMIGHARDDPTVLAAAIAYLS